MFRSLFYKTLKSLPIAISRFETKNSHIIFKKVSVWNSQPCARFCNSTEAVPCNNLTSDEIEKIAKGDPEKEKFLKMLILEVDLLRQEGALVPDNIDNKEWEQLIDIKSKSARLRYLTFLFKNEKKEENRVKRKAERKMLREVQIKEEIESGHIRYGFAGSTIFLRVYDSTMDAYMNGGLINALYYSQHVVIDCSYDQHMNHIEARNCARQLCFVFSENRQHRNPFHLQFCNVDPSSKTIQCLQRHIPTMFDTAFPLFSTPKSYLDLYPKERLVYLTPHCKNDLDEWNHDDVYIIGAMVDKSSPQPLSLAKAKEQGLRMAKLPLEKHLVWGSGASKCLTLNQMISILLDRRDTGDWKKAFAHIPRRKVVSDEQLALEGYSPSHKLKNRLIKRTGPIEEIPISSQLIKKMKTGTVDISKLFD